MKSATLALLVALVGTAWVPALAAPQNGSYVDRGDKSVTKSDGSEPLFDPAHQKPIIYEDGTVRIELQITPRRLSLRIEKDKKSAQFVILPPEIAQVNQIRRVHSGKVVVDGMFSGDVSEIVLVSLSTLAVSDKFLCYWPTISPHGDYVSFVKLFPAHPEQPVSAHYMLYDLRKNARQNRPANVDTADYKNVGFCVYPVGIGNRDLDNVRVPAAEIHTMSADRLFWDATGERLVFADIYQDQTWVVLVDLGFDRRATTKTTLLSTALCGSTVGQGGACTLRLEQVRFGDSAEPALTLSLKGTGKDIGIARQVVLSYAQFATLGSSGV